MTGACLVLLCFGANVYADLFERGNASYARGEMAEAAATYGQLVDSGVENAEVFYNLGSAYYHLGDTGRAVLNYERALALNSRFDAAGRALALAVADSKNQFERPAGFALAGRDPTLVPGITRRVSRGAGLAFWWLAWGILAAGLGVRRGWRKKASAAASAGLILATFVLAYPTPARRAGVVVAPDTPARYGPEAADAVRMALSAGDRVLVDRVIGDWARVELADGRRGWIARESVAYLGPPFEVTRNERENSTP